MYRRLTANRTCDVNRPCPHKVHLVPHEDQGAVREAGAGGEAGGLQSVWGCQQAAGLSDATQSQVWSLKLTATLLLARKPVCSLLTWRWRECSQPPCPRCLTSRRGCPGTPTRSRCPRAWCRRSAVCFYYLGIELICISSLSKLLSRVPGLRLS